MAGPKSTRTRFVGIIKSTIHVSLRLLLDYLVTNIIRCTHDNNNIIEKSKQA